MKKIFLALIFTIIFTANAFAAPVSISDQTDGVIVGSDALIPNFDGQPYRSKISDQVWQNIKSKAGKATGAICDGTSNPASDFYGSLAALQADYPAALSLGQEIDGVVLEHYLEAQTPVYLPRSDCLVNFEILLFGKDVHMKQGVGGSIKAALFETGTAQGGAAGTITLKADTVAATTNVVNGLGVRITSGTGAGQAREISAYNSTSKVANVSVNFTTHPDNTSVYELFPLQIITVQDGKAYLDDITFDLDGSSQNGIYLTGSSTEVELYMNNVKGINAGHETIQSTNLVAPVWLNGRIGRNVWHNYSCENIHSVANGQFADNVGAARCYALTPASNSAKIQGYNYNFYFNTEGSDAEELDLYNINTGCIYPSAWVNVNPTVIYTGDVRRIDKVHSCAVTNINPQYQKSASFVTAPTASATTNVGTKNLNGIDIAGSGYASITLIGGDVDLSGFQNGFTSTSSCTNCFIRAERTVLRGAIHNFNRHNPETAIVGTAVAGGADTITLNPERSSSTNDYYNTNTIEITAGTGSGQTRTVLDYTGSTRVLQVDSAWSTQPDATSVYSIYKVQTGSPNTLINSINDSGSGCINCRFIDGVYAMQLRGYDGIAQNNYFYDPVTYAIYANCSSGRTGLTIQNNKIVTLTSGRLNDASGIMPIQVCDKIMLSGNELIQRGNTNHRAQFITLRTAGVTGNAFNNIAPPTCDSCGANPVDAVYKNAASLVRVHGDNGGISSTEFINVTPANNITTGEDTLHTYALRPVAASVVGSSIVITGAGTFANNANAKTLKVHYGTVAPITKSLTPSVAGAFEYRLTIYKTGTNTQRYDSSLKYTNASGIIVEELGAGTLTQTEANTLTVKSTGEGVATNDIIENTFTVKLEN
jgi:hypothetical protein